MTRALRRLLPGLAVVSLLGLAAAVSACPFCPDNEQPFSYELENSDIGLIARLVKMPTPEEIENAPPDEPALSVFAIEKVLNGREHLEGKSRIEVPFYNRDTEEEHFLLFGYEPENLYWGSPLPMPPRAVKYVSQMAELPRSDIDNPEVGTRRLVFFQQYLNDPLKVLRDDAFGEFARASYEEVAGLGDRIRREDLVEWVQDYEIEAKHRRLYLTMLGVTREPEDAELFKRMLLDYDPEKHGNILDPLIAGYLTIAGADALPLIEERYLHNEDASFAETYAAVRALRFHGQEEDIIPRERLVEAFRPMLDRPQTAELVINDLARWEDWTVIDRVVDLFKQAEGERAMWVREPAVRYLMACPLPRADELLKELEQIDPDTVAYARAMSGPTAPGGGTTSGETSADAPEDEPEKRVAASEPQAEEDPDTAEAPAADAPADPDGPESPAAGPTPAWPTLLSVAAGFLFLAVLIYFLLTLRRQPAA